jgi:hypothetical protein
MKTRVSTFVLTLSVLVAVAILSSPLAFAQGEGGSSSGSSWSDVKEVAIWMMVGIAASAVVLGVLYLLKRRVGGFPKDPAWVAPISIQRSADLPGDDNAGHEADAHGSHATAH